jgi:methylenetetrahydrofolate dehydrogenase (NADP+) / methenyltetrahydrofolate cyclohydrolase
MPAKILDGKAVAQAVRDQLKGEVADLTKRLGRPPGLAVLLVGDDPASAIYVRNKEKAAVEIGMSSEIVRLPKTATQAQVLAAVDGLNEDPLIDGFIVQMPLPKGIDDQTVLLRIEPAKDADGLHPTSLGKLASGIAGPRSCTPSGAMRLIDESGVDLNGARAVVIGRSEIVGKPMALMLLERNATVTICHSRTRDLAGEVRRANVVVAAVGKAGIVKGDWIGEGAVVIDVGINRVDTKVVGDVDFEGAKERAAFITPVPGGVGPMTVAMLLKNTCDLARLKLA